MCLPLKLYYKTKLYYYSLTKERFQKWNVSLNRLDINSLNILRTAPHFYCNLKKISHDFMIVFRSKINQTLAEYFSCFLNLPGRYCLQFLVNIRTNSLKSIFFLFESNSDFVLHSANYRLRQKCSFLNILIFSPEMKVSNLEISAYDF